MELPPKVYETIYYQMAEDQYNHYYQVADDMLFSLDELRPSTIYRMFSALQAVISGKYVYDDGKHFRTCAMFKSPLDNPRFQALLSLLEQIDGEKAIIFCKYSDEVNAICNLLDGKAVKLTGDVPQKIRQDVVNSFADSFQYLIANKNCAGYGLNLQFCRNVIYFSNDWDLATRLQSEDRVHRIGQEKEVYIYDLIADHTLDVRIRDCLVRKEHILNALRGEIDDQKDNKELLKDWIKGVIDGDEGISGKECVRSIS